MKATIRNLPRFAKKDDGILASPQEGLNHIIPNIIKALGFLENLKISPDYEKYQLVLETTTDILGNGGEVMNMIGYALGGFEPPIEVALEDKKWTIVCC